MRKAKRKPGYYLLFRREEGQKVWLYEWLQRHELNARLRKGWKIER